MENEIVRDAIAGEIARLAQIIKENPGCHLEVNRRDENRWTLYKEKPIWDEQTGVTDEYIKEKMLVTSNDFDFPGISGLNEIDPVLYKAMAVALGITLAPEE